MKENDLKLAPEKTEVIILSGRQKLTWLAVKDDNSEPKCN
ncbi:unnamed protein product [Acanthoscelides obtectus]|uniref:Uncharacterized protein n=1 Tax=Acanthoscelides obtectus TaxID=200917 RepID=A0A9P0LVN2_ACAOB|nr:unnamed protein product [Acanthoscelides obtectus]CAK1659309.1 hypothetical protein AOBTE_LOCUS21402 [Acanthoscelides obtectus]